MTALAPKQASGGNNEPAPSFASCEAHRVVGRRMPSLIALTSLLFRVRGYAPPVGAGSMRGPALIPREVCCPRTHAPSFSPFSGISASSTAGRPPQSSRGPGFRRSGAEAPLPPFAGEQGREPRALHRADRGCAVRHPEAGCAKGSSLPRRRCHSTDVLQSGCEQQQGAEQVREDDQDDQAGVARVP